MSSTGLPSSSCVELVVSLNVSTGSGMTSTGFVSTVGVACLTTGRLVFSWSLLAMRSLAAASVMVAISDCEGMVIVLPSIIEWMSLFLNA